VDSSTLVAFSFLLVFLVGEDASFLGGLISSKRIPAIVWEVATRLLYRWCPILRLCSHRKDLALNKHLPELFAINNVALK